MVNREVLKHMLGQLGMKADIAENGEIAVAAAHSAAYDLILMDMQMPVMNGLTATEVIRGLSGYATTPIVAITANAFDEDRQRCLDAGMSDFLTKPVRPAALRAVLAKWLSEDGETRSRDDQM